MKMTLNIEPCGMVNTARAIEGNDLKISTLLRMQSLQEDDIFYEILFAVNNPDYQQRTVEVFAEKLYEIIDVARNWQKSNYKLVK